MERKLYTDAMHSRERLTFLSSDDERFSTEMAKLASRKPIWEIAKQDIDQLSRDLIEQNWPDARKRVLHTDDGSWRYFKSPDDIKRGEKLSFGSFYIRSQTEPLSEPYEIAELIASAGSFLQVYEEGKLDSAVTYCAVYVTRRANFLSRASFYSRVERGKKVHEGASAGGRTTSAMSASKTKAVLLEMQRLIDDGKSVSRAAEITARKNIGTSKGANRRLWTRWKPK